MSEKGIVIEKDLKRVVLEKVCEYYHTFHKPAGFVPGHSRIPYSGRIYNEKEMMALVDAALDFWLTTGRYADRFEKAFAELLGIRHCSLTNSGSSANLLAFMSLTSPKLGDRRIKKGDEVITVAAAFPTTVTPIIHYGAVPVFVDVTIPAYNMDADHLEEALSGRTRAVMAAHTLGNPFDLQKVKDFCDRHHLWLIEDNCDALGSRYRWGAEWRYTGTIGDVGTSSFYPPHHITMGEGGAVYTNLTQLKRIVDSFRDWGRDCRCASGHDNTCQKRFHWQLGDLPYGYDHKYTYSHFGYNLKLTDMQAAIGCAQLEKLPEFIRLRKRNWDLLRTGLHDLSDRFILPERTSGTDPSWFGFLLTIREEAGFTRDRIVAYLEAHGIQTRMLFAGNIIRHPAFDEMRHKNKGYRVAGALQNTDHIMHHTFWIGVYPGITEGMIDYIIETFHNFIKAL